MGGGGCYKWKLSPLSGTLHKGSGKRCAGLRALALLQVLGGTCVVSTTIVAGAKQQADESAHWAMNRAWKSCWN